jgi:DNA primase
MPNWVDFAAVKQQAGLGTVLRQYGVPLRRSGRDQYRGRCPIHRGEGRDAFHANLSRNIFHCFSCGAGGTVLDFVAAMEHCTLPDAARKLAAKQPGSRLRAPTACQTKPLVTKRTRVLPLGFVLRGIDSAHPYLNARGIDTCTAAEFGVGFYAGPGLFHRRLVIPIRDERGELVGYCGRALDGSEPRYLFPSRFPKSEMLFNLHRAVAVGEPSVVVVEGFFDCLKVHQAGIRSVVALMGTALYPSRWRPNLRYAPNVRCVS